MGKLFVPFRCNRRNLERICAIFIWPGVQVSIILFIQWAKNLVLDYQQYNEHLVDCSFFSANTSVAKVCYFWWCKSLIIFSSSKEDSSRERQHCCEERKLSLAFSQLDHLRLCFKRGRGLEIKLIQRCHYVTDNVGNPFTSKLNDGFFTGSIFVNNKS